jgi:Family of unknown function (DUF6503)
MKQFISIFALLSALALSGGFNSVAQSLTGTELLDRAINYHDPKGQWQQFSGVLEITLTRPKKPSRRSEVTIDLPREYYRMSTTSEKSETIFELKRDKCSITWNGKTEFSQEETEKNRLSCERAVFMRNYYIYLYGLPMKLKDPGTNVHDEVQVKSFKGKQYNVLKVTYDKSVGKDIWYFYFDQNTNAMEVYQFFYDESKNDGEYILLDGTVEYGRIKIPKNRTWYTNQDEKLLGTDMLLKITKFYR